MHSLGEEQIARANGIEIAFQEIGDPDGEPLLLVMGLGTQMLAWQPDFCALLADRGFRVVRFDNRDIGRSTKLRGAGVPSRLDLLRRRRSTAPYLLRDMAADAFGLMDHLEIESAHVTGASMGGMIVQQMAIDRPERVRSLVSIMSSTGSRWTGQPTWRAMAMLLARSPRGREETIQRAIKTFELIGSPDYDTDVEALRDIVGRSYDRGHSPAGVLRQLHAIIASGDRTEALHRVTVPTTVIHGAKDPLVQPSGGKATAKAIPGARLKMIPGMGHDLPRELWPTFVDEIAATAARADASRVEQPA